MCEVGMGLYASFLVAFLTPLNNSSNAGETGERVFHFTPGRNHNNGRVLRGGEENLEYAIIIKNEGNHPFPLDHKIEIWGGRWVDENGNLETPDGTVPVGSFKVVPESELEPVQGGWFF